MAREVSEIIAGLSPTQIRCIADGDKPRRVGRYWPPTRKALVKMGLLVGFALTQDGERVRAAIEKDRRNG